MLVYYNNVYISILFKTTSLTPLIYLLILVFGAIGTPLLIYYDQGLILDSELITQLISHLQPVGSGCPGSFPISASASPCIGITTVAGWKKSN